MGTSLWERRLKTLLRAPPARPPPKATRLSQPPFVRMGLREHVDERRERRTESIDHRALLPLAGEKTIYRRHGNRPFTPGGGTTTKDAPMNIEIRRPAMIAEITIFSNGARNPESGEPMDSSWRPVETRRDGDDRREHNLGFPPRDHD